MSITSGTWGLLLLACWNTCTLWLPSPHFCHTPVSGNHHCIICFDDLSVLRTQVDVCLNDNNSHARPTLRRWVYRWDFGRTRYSAPRGLRLCTAAPSGTEPASGSPQKFTWEPWSSYPRMRKAEKVESLQDLQRPVSCCHLQWGQVVTSRRNSHRWRKTRRKMPPALRTGKATCFGNQIQLFSL